MDLWTQWGKISVRRTEQSSTDMCALSRIKQLLGSCCVPQGAQPDTLEGWGGVGERGSGTREYMDDFD